MSGGGSIAREAIEAHDGAEEMSDITPANIFEVITIDVYEQLMIKMKENVKILKLANQKLNRHGIRYTVLEKQLKLLEEIVRNGGETK